MVKYTTMQGKPIDMDKLMRQHETMPAVGNMKVNARGDELGPGGKVIKKREDIVAEYYETNPKARKKINEPAVADPVNSAQSIKPASSAPLTVESAPVQKHKKSTTEE